VKELKATEKDHWIWTNTKYCYNPPIEEAEEMGEATAEVVQNVLAGNAFTAAELKATEKDHWIWTNTKYCYCSANTRGSVFIEYGPEHLIDVMRKNRISKEDDNGQAAQ